MTSLSNSVAVGDEELFHDNLINKISKSENGDEDLQFIVSTLWNDQQSNHMEG